LAKSHEGSVARDASGKTVKAAQSRVARRRVRIVVLGTVGWAHLR
jgi:hypothetical protein